MSGLQVRAAPAAKEQPQISGQHREAFAQFLAEFSWTHFATFTAATRSDDCLLTEYRKTIRRLERVAQGPVRSFWVVERGLFGTPHLHALLTGTERVTCARIERSWRLGHSEVRVYDPELKATFYVTKTLGDEEARWDLSAKLGEFEIPKALSEAQFEEKYGDVPCPFDFM